MRKEVISAIAALETDGRITPDVVLDAARDPASALHDQFEWDDSVAAHKHRLGQARQLIRNVEVHVTINRVRTGAVAYIRDPESEHRTQGYISVRKARSDEELARQAVDAEFEAAAARLRRARDLAVVLGLADEIDLHLDGLIEFRARIMVPAGTPAGETARPN